MKTFALLILAACSGAFEPAEDWAEPVPRFAVTDSAAKLASDCAARRHLPVLRSYQSLALFLVRGNSFDLDGRVSEGLELPMRGYTVKNRAYLVRDRLNDVLWWAHELLHAMYGLAGNSERGTWHDPLFYECGLYPL